MTKTQNNKPIAYYNSGLSGVLIYDILYGIEDYVVCSHSTDVKGKFHKCKIYSNNKGHYFKCNNQRIYLDECVKTNIY